MAAAQLWGSCDTARIAQTVPRLAHDQAFCDRYIGIAKVQLGVEDFQTAHRLGTSLALDQAVQLALDLTPMSESKPPLRRARRTYPAGLTPREVEVLRLVAQGLSDHEVAEKLVLSPRTINAHLTSIYSKLDVNSRVAATRFAMEHGLAS